MNDFQKKVKEKIKMYSNKQYLDEYINNEYLTDDGDADIFLKISHKDEIFDNRTLGAQLDLNSDIYDFIEEKTSMLNNDVQINLHIVGCRLNHKEQESIKHIIKEHYAIELYKKQKEYDEKKIKVVFLFLLGFFTLLFYMLLYLFTNLQFFMEVFGFIFSFALWEAFDLLIYDSTYVKNQREALTQNLLTEVNFEYEEKFNIV